MSCLPASLQHVAWILPVNWVTKHHSTAAKVQNNAKITFTLKSNNCLVDALLLVFNWNRILADQIQLIWIGSDITFSTLIFQLELKIQELKHFSFPNSIKTNIQSFLIANRLDWLCVFPYVSILWHVLLLPYWHTASSCPTKYIWICLLSHEVRVRQNMS